MFEIRPPTSKKCVNKDLAGGMGTRTWVGESLGARVFEYIKNENVVLPNITAAYLAAIFKKAGWEVGVVKIDDAEVLQEKGDLALVPVSIVDCEHELEVVKGLKSQGLHVGVYGTFASAKPEFFLNDADFVIKGEVEAGVLKIAQETLKTEWPKGVFEVEPIKNVDELPFPDWTQFPINKYSYSPALIKKPVLTMLTSRGCPYSCSFYCPYPITAGKKWRARSVENIIKEMEYLKNEYGVKAIDFRDAIFTLDKERTLRLCQSIIEKKLDIIWSCETRLDCLDEGLIEVMHQAGLRNLNVGIESASAEVLKKSNRLPIEVSHQEGIISYCHKLGISVAAFYILGLEGATEESILATIDYASKLNTLVAQFTISTPYPGTSFFDKLQSEGRLLTVSWEDYDAYTPVFRHNNLTPQQLLRLKEKAFVSYYFRLPYLFKHIFRLSYLSKQLKLIPKYIFKKFL